LPRKTTENAANLCTWVGDALRKARQAKGLTIQDVCGLAGISRGMWSRIENGESMPSLDTLARACKATGLSLTRMFKDYDLPEGVAQHVPAGQGMQVVRRGTRQLFEPFLITLDDKSEIFPRFQHPGVEFIYMLKGKLEYRHGNRLFRLKPGDAFTFEGDVPHGPERLLQVPIQFLAIIYYPQVER
jgi:transcriptional regulator with XRE-family HTH domain